MKKKILFIIFLIFLYGCSYFQVKDAIKEAENGNYVVSLNNLLEILKEKNDDRRTLDAFEIIYPEAEKKYYDELDISREWDIVRYTKALLNLLRIQDIYYKLPENSKNSIAIIEPPVKERDGIKKELAQSFYTLGIGSRDVTYEEKLRAYGYFSQAEQYNIENRKDIKEKYLSSQKKALGKFLLDFKGEKSLVLQLKEGIKSNLSKYPLFSLGNKSNYNLKLDVDISEIKYLPPRVTTESGIDSYTERVVKRVLERVVETKIINGQSVQVERVVPVDKEVEVEIYYRYFIHTKKTSMEYYISHNLYEKNSTPISSENKRIIYEDSVSWTEYYPLSPFIGVRPFRFPISEGEKYVLSKEALKEKVIELGNNHLDMILNRLDSNRIIAW